MFYSSKWIYVQSQHLNNPFEPNFPFLHLLKTSENQRSTSIAVFELVIAHTGSVLVSTAHYEIVCCAYFYCQNIQYTVQHLSLSLSMFYACWYLLESHFSFFSFTPNLFRSNNSLKIFRIPNYSKICQNSFSLFIFSYCNCMLCWERRNLCVANFYAKNQSFLQHWIEKNVAFTFLRQNILDHFHSNF